MAFSIGTCVWVVWVTVLLTYVWCKTGRLERQMADNRQHASREADEVDENPERLDENGGGSDGTGTGAEPVNSSDAAQEGIDDPLDGQQQESR